jgi:hypothetical protein
MNIVVKASDLKYKYPKDTVNRELPKFSGKPDLHPFNRDDLYELLPMLSAVMSTLATDDGRIVHFLEDIINHELPACITARQDVYDCLVDAGRDALTCR